MLSTRRGYTTIEYAGLIAVVMAALLTMTLYVFRAVCGKWRDSANTLGDGRQYEFGVTTINGQVR